jgi:hypothetical protein
MLVVKIHKVAVVVAFVLLNIWLLVGSLFAPASGQIQHNQTTAEVWVAAFTGVLAFSTIGLWFVTWIAANAALRQATLSREEFISTHRPRLLVRQFQLVPPIPNQVVKIKFSIINIGDTEAIWKFIAAEAALWNGRYWEAPGIDFVQKPISEKPIKNGQRVSITIQSRFNVTPEQIEAVEQQKLIICAVGELIYADLQGTQRRTGFRRNYDFPTDMFIASQNQDQEYQD